VQVFPANPSQTIRGPVHAHESACRKPPVKGKAGFIIAVGQGWYELVQE